MAELVNVFVLENQKREQWKKLVPIVYGQIPDILQKMAGQPGMEAFHVNYFNYPEALRKAESDINNYDPIRLPSALPTSAITPDTTPPSETTPTIPENLRNRRNRGLVYDLKLAETKKEHINIRINDLGERDATIMEMGRRYGAGAGKYKDAYQGVYELKWKALDKYAEILEKKNKVQKKQDKLYVQFKKENIQEKWGALDKLKEELKLAKSQPEPNDEQKNNIEEKEKEIKELDKSIKPFFSDLHEVRENIRRHSRDMGFASSDAAVLSSLTDRVTRDCSPQTLERMVSSKSDYKKFQEIRDDVWGKYNKAYDAAGKMYKNDPGAEQVLRDKLGTADKPGTDPYVYKNREVFAKRDDLEDDARALDKMFSKAISGVGSHMGVGPRNLKVLKNEAEKYKLGTKVRNGLRDGFIKELKGLNEIKKPSEEYDRQQRKVDDLKEDYELVRDVLKDVAKNPQRTATFKNTETGLIFKGLQEVTFEGGKKSFSVKKGESDFDLLKKLQGARNDIRTKLDKTAKTLSDLEETSKRDQGLLDRTQKDLKELQDKPVETMNPSVRAASSIAIDKLKKEAETLKALKVKNESEKIFLERTKKDLEGDYKQTKELMGGLKGRETPPPPIAPGDRGMLLELDKKFDDLKEARNNRNNILRQMKSDPANKEQYERDYEAAKQEVTRIADTPLPSQLSASPTPTVAADNPQLTAGASATPTQDLGSAAGAPAAADAAAVAGPAAAPAAETPVALAPAGSAASSAPADGAAVAGPAAAPAAETPVVLAPAGPAASSAPADGAAVAGPAAAPASLAPAATATMGSPAPSGPSAFAAAPASNDSQGAQMTALHQKLEKFALSGATVQQDKPGHPTGQLLIPQSASHNAVADQQHNAQLLSVAAAKAEDAKKLQEQQQVAALADNGSRAAAGPGRPP